MPPGPACLNLAQAPLSGWTGMHPTSVLRAAETAAGLYEVPRTVTYEHRLTTTVATSRVPKPGSMLAAS